MCGINGFIQFKLYRDKRELYNLVHDMNEQIIHRGPDYEGIYADEICSLGMRRLSIIDLKNGSQPIWNEDHTRMIVFNGEIYNFKYLKAILKSKGYSFKTNSDTEVILIAYEEYGCECFNLLEGMFAVAIYDTKSSEWIIARDRGGEKPLYYSYNEEFFIFGSELKSLIHTGHIKKEIDIDALSIYFQLSYIPAPKSIIKGINKLMPGTFMKISKNGCLEVHRFWTLKPQEKVDEYQNYDKCKKELREKLFASVERRLVSDVPLGAFLSGGFDSSIIVGIMSQISNERINTFNIAFKETQYDESALAKLVAHKNNTRHSELLLDWDEVLKSIDTILSNIDEPFADSSLIATYAVSKLAKKYVTVVLTGDAGDELFAGYNKYLGNYYANRYRKIPRLFRKSIIEPCVAALPSNKTITRKANKVIKTAGMSEFDRMIWLMSMGYKTSELTQLIPGLNTRTLDFVEEQYYEVLDCDDQTRIQYIDFNTVLEGDMLAKVDRGSMLASLETRVPMLDKNVIELAFNIILKDTFKDLLPVELFDAPKHGFGVPIGNWLEGELFERLRKYSSEDFIESQGVFDLRYINRIIEEHVNHKLDRSSELWTFFVFQNWYERIIIPNQAG